MFNKEIRCPSCGATEKEAIERDNGFFSFNSAVCSRYDCYPKERFENLNVKKGGS